MSQLKKRALRAAVAILLVISIPAGILFAGYLALPVYFESILLPGLFEKTGIAPLECRIRKIGFTGLDAGPIQFGDSTRTALLIRSLQVDYTLTGLLKKKIKTARFTGVTLHCAFENGVFTIPGLDLAPILEASRPPPGPPTPPETGSRETGPLEMLPDRIELRSSILAVTTNHKVHRIPFELIITSKDDGVLNGMVRIYPRGQTLTAAAVLLFEANSASASLKADAIQISRFSDLAAGIVPDVEKGVPGLHLSGEIDVKADAGFSLSPFSLNHLDAVLAWKNAAVDHNTLRIRPMDTLDKKEEPLQIHLTGEGAGKWGLDLTPFVVRTPIPLTLSDFHMDMETGERLTRLTGRAALGVKQSPPKSAGPVSFGENTGTMVYFSADFPKTGEWHAGISNQSPNKSLLKKERIHLEINGTDLVSEMPLAFISASGDGDRVAVQVETTAKNILLKRHAAVVRIPAVDLTSNVVIHKDRLTAQYQASLSSTRFTAGSILGTIPVFSFSGEVQKPNHQPPQIKGFLKLSNVSLTDSASLLKIEGAGASLPVSWPGPASGKGGKVVMKRVWIADRLSGPVAGTIRQENMGVQFSGTHQSSLLPGLTALFSGKIQPLTSGGQTAALLFEIPALPLTPGVDLEQFIPAARGGTLAGTLSAAGKLEAGDRGLEGTAWFRLDNGRVSMEEYDIAVEGLQTRVQIPDLIEFNSEPDQRLVFEKATIGTLAMTRGEIHFQIESPASLFIEKSSVGWCNGRVNAPSLRILPKSDETNLTLYCSRLDLAMMLSQLGNMNAEGKGTVNGKIPIEIRNGEIKITDGFLNSIPGDEGVIRINGAETLAQRAFTGSPQFGQLELALEALRDYRYQWANLELNSEADALLMRLQFDGKPAKPLPFEFLPEQGGFARVGPGKAGSLFQGIRLDVNLKLPLNEFLRYKNVLDMVQ